MDLFVRVYEKQCTYCIWFYEGCGVRFYMVLNLLGDNGHMACWVGSRDFHHKLDVFSGEVVYMQNVVSFLP